MKTIEMLRQEMAQAHEQAVAIQARADADARELTADELQQMERYFQSYDDTKSEIERRERLDRMAGELNRPTGRKVPQPDPQDRGSSLDGIQHISEPVETKQVRDRWGWRSMGEFALAVRSALPQFGQRMDNRLAVRMAPTTYGTEGIGPDGGFAVPPDFRREIMNLLGGEGSLMALCDQIPTGSNQLVVPQDADPVWNNASGIRVFWEGEADAATQSKPALKQHITSLQNIIALVGMTEQLLEDAPALDAYLRRKAPEKLTFAIDLAILQGTGVGKPLGILNSPSLVTVAKETDQVADTILTQNITKMWMRCWGRSRGRAVWVHNQDIEAQLLSLNAGTQVWGTPSNTAVQVWPVYMPPGGLANSPNGTLMGRPMIAHQACETLGDLGDIFLADFSQYCLPIKSGGIRTDVSMHLWFDYAMQAFRFMFRVGGQPWWPSTVAARDGTTTFSPFVTLAERG